MRAKVLNEDAMVFNISTCLSSTSNDFFTLSPPIGPSCKFFSICCSVSFMGVSGFLIS